jgi:molybdopterin molybdotransferase
VSFDTFVMVDWSGGNDRGPAPKKDAIWAAVLRGGVAAPSKYLRNRQVAETWLVALFDEELAAGRHVLVGFDFPFGYPDGFAQALIGNAAPQALWDWFAHHLADAPDGNNRFELAAQINAQFPGVGPFWFNAGPVDFPDLPRKGRDRHGHGMPEKRQCEQLAQGAFSCWQMGGAGAVGSQVFTGLAVLSRLRAIFATQVSVWPFEPLNTPIVFAEIWPSLYADEVRAETKPGDIKDEVQVRLLAQRFARAQASGELVRHLAAAPKAARAGEGWILGVAA